MIVVLPVQIISEIIFCRVKVSKRRDSTKIQVMGNFAGARVVRGPDWDWGNQDGKFSPTCFSLFLYLSYSKALLMSSHNIHFYGEILHKNICCRYSLEVPQNGASIRNKKNCSRIVIKYSSLINCSLEAPKKVTGKECRPISDAAE